MLHPVKVIDIELSQSIPDVNHLEGYMALKALVRLHGVPLGYVQAPITLGRCSAQTLSKLILEHYSWAIIAQLLKNGLASPDRPTDLRLEDLVNLPPAPFEGEMPRVTVAVCTRDRPDDMKLCLAAICQLDYPNLEILVVDNAPTTEGTKTLIDNHYPQVRYVREPRPGLDWARNRAILEATGEIIAYTDDDVVVDKGWVKAIAQTFVENPEVMALTGLVAPYELETEAQILFEMYGGFGRGFEQKWYRKTHKNLPWQWFGAGQFGTGANMAYRRSLFEKIGYFDPALDVGTVTNGGGDLEMFIRVLKEGYTLVYEPKAMIRHRHRRDYSVLRRQISYNGIGLYSVWDCLRAIYPDEQVSLLYISIWWLLWWHLRRFMLSYLHPHRFPRDLILVEFMSVFRHFGVYSQASRNAKEIASQYFSEPSPPFIRDPNKQDSSLHFNILESRKIAIRQIDLGEPLSSIEDVSNYPTTRLFVTWKDKILGTTDIHNAGLNLTRHRLIESLAPLFGLKQYEAGLNWNSDQVWHSVNSLVADTLLPKSQLNLTSEILPTHISVSIVIATYDRPDDLRNCLQCLNEQQSKRHIEIIVVDNNPASGLTSSIVQDFPEVILISEERKGLSYARNAGIVASHGDIILTTDDDVTVPSNWVENILVPFNRNDVMVVTGNVLPVELETEAQQCFENYGGLGRGFKSREVNGDWFEACPYRTVPTWDLGATANAAFRASIFRDPQIGLIDEALGAGTPTGCSEDTYMFYKVLKLGYTIFYEPNAYVWHRHRNSKSALRKQIYNYSKGHVAYHLTTLLNDGDLRVLARLLVGLPLAHLSRIYYRLRKWSDYPILLVLVEWMGNLAGPWALLQSRIRVCRLGRSEALSEVYRQEVVYSAECIPTPSCSEISSSEVSGIVD
jgi:GT2 family glycosyltransferase